MDSLSSVQAHQTRAISPKGHPLIYDCDEAFWRLSRESYDISIDIGWVPSHVGVRGNEKADLLAKSAATGINILATPAHNFDLKF
jgi:ribonuclease HI